MIILDTDHVTLLQWGEAPATRILARLDSGEHEGPAITSIITYEEQMRGWLSRLAAANNIKEEIATYRKLSRNLAFFGSLKVLEFSELEANEFQRLRGLRILIGTMDLKIAAIALANNATLWSRNLVDFRKVPGLQVEDASA